MLACFKMALMYTFAQENPDQTVGFFIVQIPAKYLPYAQLAVTLLLNGPGAVIIEAMGIVAAHAFEFFEKIWPEFGGGPRLIFVPAFVQRLFAGEPGVGERRTYGTSFAPRPVGTGPGAQSGRSNAGWSSGSAWGNRGAGRRLGGD